jgi:hypothetical protein
MINYELRGREKVVWKLAEHVEKIVMANVKRSIKVLLVVVLCSATISLVFANTNYETASPVWQKEFAYDGFSCFPHLLEVGGNGKIVIIGTMLNQRDRESIGRVWQWILDEKTGERLKDITLKSAKRKDCGVISSFWATKGLDVAGDNEIQLLVDPMERGGKRGIIKYKDGRIIKKHETKVKVTWGDFFARGIKRFNAKEYFLFGADKKDQNGVLQKRNNSGDVIWEKQYQYEGWSGVSGIARSKSDGLLVITGWTRHKDSRSASAWINIIADDGAVIGREVFDINTIDFIRVPQIAVLDNNNIAVVYNKTCAEPVQVTGIEYRIYSADLKLKLKGSVAAAKMDHLFYGMATVDRGFVIVHDVLEPGIQYKILNHYDHDGKKIRAIKIDGVGTLADQVVIDSEGKMVYLASLKPPCHPPTRTVVTAIELNEE